VFAAWADPAEKTRWFAGPKDWESGKCELDFRVGGRERTSGGPQGGPVHYYEARYQDIVPNERIVSTYDMPLDDRRIAVSLATVEFKPEGRGTRLVFTEQALTWTASTIRHCASAARATCWMRWGRRCEVSQRGREYRIPQVIPSASPPPGRAGRVVV
jgi:uncharacterized protein YndB with AHSA1/START domain